jgi:hypothetical protein
MDISTFELRNIFASGVEVGIQWHIERSDNGAGFLKKREVYKLLKSMGEKQTLLDTMIKDKLVKGERKGKAKNSPNYVQKKRTADSVERNKNKKIMITP